MEKILGDRIIRTWHLSEETKREDWLEGSSEFLNVGE